MNSNCTKEEFLDFVKTESIKDNEYKNPFWNLPIISSETEMKEGGWRRDVRKEKTIEDIFEECGYEEGDFSDGGSFLQINAYLRTAVSVIRDLTKNGYPTDASSI